MSDTPEHHDWVLAAPFRAHLRQLHAMTGLPWPVLALAAGVSPALVRHLVLGHRGRQLRRLSPVSARRLLRLDAARLAELATEWVPAQTTAERVARLLAAGCDPEALARWCRVSPSQLVELTQARRCTRLVAFLVEAACPPALLGELEAGHEAVA